VFRRPMFLVPALIAGLALPVAPALAGEDDDGGSGSGTLDTVRNCVNHSRAKVTLSGDEVDSVVFYVDGRRVKAVDEPTVNGTYVMAMRCSRLTPGAHRGRAVVTDTAGDNSTLRFTLARTAQAAPRFTG
jgi:hypothetical protein